jgi:hypothetical protein
MRSVVLSVSVDHHCERIDGQPRSLLQVKGKTMEDAVARWNERVAP